MNYLNNKSVCSITFLDAQGRAITEQQWEAQRAARAAGSLNHFSAIGARAEPPSKASLSSSLASRVDGLVADHPILNRTKPSAFQRHAQQLTDLEKAQADRLAKIMRKPRGN